VRMISFRRNMEYKKCRTEAAHSRCSPCMTLATGRLLQLPLTRLWDALRPTARRSTASAENRDSQGEYVPTHTEHRPAQCRIVSCGQRVSGGRAASTLWWQTDPLAVIAGDGQHFRFWCEAVTEDDGRWRICGLQQNLTDAAVVFVVRSVMVRRVMVRRVSAVERARLAQAAARRDGPFGHRDGILNMVVLVKGLTKYERNDNGNCDCHFRANVCDPATNHHESKHSKTRFNGRIPPPASTVSGRAM